MPSVALGTLSAVNLIAGASILGNIGGIAFTTNADLSNNISTYTSIGVVNQFASLAGTGYISINIAANSFPALTNAIPTAYQSNLGSGTITSAITAQSANILGFGDVGKFEQVFNSAYSFEQTTNQLIKSCINATDPNVTTTFTTMDTTVTGGLSDLTLATESFGNDLLKLGNLINFEDLGNFGSPASVLVQIGRYTHTTPALNTALLNSGLSVTIDGNLSVNNFNYAQQKLVYQAMTKITGSDLAEILNLLKITTRGLTTMADLLNPVKIFPTSFITLTAPTINGLRAIYLDSVGTINSLLATTLPAAVLIPINGNSITAGIPYSELRKIVPEDQALGSKAINAALDQVKTIFNTTSRRLAITAQTLETNYGLNLINSLTQPLPQAVINFYETAFADGTGPDGLLLLADIIGTPSGWVHNQALSNTITVMNTLTSTGAFFNLTNGNNGVYTVMANTVDGDYTTFTPGVDPDPGTYTVTIPSGLPGAGTYSGYPESAAVQLAFTNGLTPALTANINTIVTTNSTLVGYANTNWNNISAQIIRENVNQSRAGIVIANLQPNVQATSLVTNLTTYGVDTNEGGAAYILTGVSNIGSQGGQAVISTMRQARNQVKLSDAGIQTDIDLSDTVAQPQANLGQSQYTINQAASQKII
jgi:hypothetical protein